MEKSRGLWKITFCCRESTCVLVMFAMTNSVMLRMLKGKPADISKDSLRSLLLDGLSKSPELARVDSRNSMPSKPDS